MPRRSTRESLCCEPDGRPKRETNSGRISKVVAQGVSFFVRVGSLMILARLLGFRSFPGSFSSRYFSTLVHLCSYALLCNEAEGFLPGYCARHETAANRGEKSCTSLDKSSTSILRI